jgi:hypothetical protein
MACTTRVRGYPIRAGHRAGDSLSTRENPRRSCVGPPAGPGGQTPKVANQIIAGPVRTLELLADHDMACS